MSYLCYVRRARTMNPEPALFQNYHRRLESRSNAFQASAMPKTEAEVSSIGTFMTSWSGDDEDSARTSKSRADQDDKDVSGVPIPSLLQLLFDLEFLPYARTIEEHHVGNESLLFNVAQTNEKLTRNDSSLHSSCEEECSSQSSSANSNAIVYKENSTRIVGQDDLLETSMTMPNDEDRSIAVSSIGCSIEQDDDLILTVSAKTLKKKKRGVTGILKAAGKGIIQKMSRNKGDSSAGNRKDRSLSWDNSVSFKRKKKKHRLNGKTAEEKSSTKCTNEKAIDATQELLDLLSCVEEKTKAVQTEALEREYRVEEAHQKVQHLQVELEKSMEVLRIEMEGLVVTKLRLDNLYSKATTTAEQVEAAVSIWASSASIDNESTPLNTSLPLISNPREEVSPSQIYHSKRLATMTSPGVSCSSLLTNPEVAPPYTIKQQTSLLVETDVDPQENVASACVDSLSLQRSNSRSYMRVNDLDLENDECPNLQGSLSRDLFLIDDNICLIAQKLKDFGRDVVVDESERFIPTRDTQRILKKSDKNLMERSKDDSWAFGPWTTCPSENDILVWVGKAPEDYFGHDWPMVKTRGIVRTSSRKMMDLLWDSSRVRQYNKMSRGREDVIVLQNDIETQAKDSTFGFAGGAKVVKSLNKHPLFPKAIETLSLMLAHRVVAETYIMVNRAVWETANTSNIVMAKDRLRSEILLGVTLIRPLDNFCEITTLNHVSAAGVPEMLAKRAAPGQAASMVRELQSLFRPKT